jgi:hypothetical protein
VSTHFRPVGSLCAGVRWWLPLLTIAAAIAADAPVCLAQQQPDKPVTQPPAEKLQTREANDQAAAGDLAASKRPDPINPFDGFPVLRAIPIPHDRPQFNIQMVNAAVLPRDKEGIWVLDFAFKPLRIKTVEIPGRGRVRVHYLYYRVVNHTGKPRIFVPQFIMVNEAGQKFHDAVIPQAIPVIQMREDNTIPLLGAVNVIGLVPPSAKQDVDDAVFGVATWDKWDPKADRFSIYVRGLSDGYKEIKQEDTSKPPVIKYKTLRIDLIRRGDEHDLTEKEIQFADPPYEWVYW